jgi:Protein of unknown function (DUF4089)
MASEPPNIEAIAERLGFPVPEAYRAGVAEAFARLLEQAALVMSADMEEKPDSALDFVP